MTFVWSFIVVYISFLLQRADSPKSERLIVITGRATRSPSVCYLQQLTAFIICVAMLTSPFSSLRSSSACFLLGSGITSSRIFNSRWVNIKSKDLRMPIITTSCKSYIQFSIGFFINTYRLNCEIDSFSIL